MVEVDVLQGALGWEDEEQAQLLMDELTRAGLEIVMVRSNHRLIGDRVKTLSELNKTLSFMGSMKDRKTQASLIKQVTEQILALSK